MPYKIIKLSAHNFAIKSNKFYFIRCDAHWIIKYDHRTECFEKKLHKSSRFLIFKCKFIFNNFISFIYYTRQHPHISVHSNINRISMFILRNRHQVCILLFFAVRMLNRKDEPLLEILSTDKWACESKASGKQFLTASWIYILVVFVAAHKISCSLKWENNSKRKRN